MISHYYSCWGLPVFGEIWYDGGSLESEGADISSPLTTIGRELWRDSWVMHQPTVDRMTIIISRTLQTALWLWKSIIPTMECRPRVDRLCFAARYSRLFINVYDITDHTCFHRLYSHFIWQRCFSIVCDMCDSSIVATGATLHTWSQILGARAFLFILRR